MRGPIFMANMKDFYILTKSTVSDNRGGFKSTYTKGNAVKAVLTPSRLDTEMIVQIADAQTALASLVLFTEKSVLIPFDTVIMRASDNKTYKVITDPTDQASPDTAPIFLRMHGVEEFELDGELVEPEPEPVTGVIGND